MFGVQLDGAEIVFCDNESVFQKKSMPKFTIRNKQNSIWYHRCRDPVAAKVIRISKKGIEKNISDFSEKNWLLSGGDLS